MSGFIEGKDRNQATLFPERIDDYISEESAVRVIDVLIDELDLSGLGFKTVAEATGRPDYHPALMLKLYIYGYLNRIQSSRRLEREAGRNVELMWLLGHLHKKEQADPALPLLTPPSRAPPETLALFPGKDSGPTALDQQGRQ